MARMQEDEFKFPDEQEETKSAAQEDFEFEIEDDTPPRS